MNFLVALYRGYIVGFCDFLVISCHGYIVAQVVVFKYYYLKIYILLFWNRPTLYQLK